jgi:uncharacterized protein (TIGR02145 family)
MKAIISFQKKAHWFLALVTLIPWLLFLVLPSCQKDEFEIDSMRNMPSMSCTGLPINGKPILYYGPETFKITSKALVKETRTLSNPNFDSFDGNFILKVQNGSHGKTKVEKIEIRIDDILIVSSSDFRKKGNIISKPITLSANSTMEIKLKVDKRSFIVLWIEGTLKEEMTVTDVEGNVYKTVTIGTQVWMAENLKTTKYKDGEKIPLITESSESANPPTPAYYWYDNDEATYKNDYGALYNWYTVNTGKLCPAGWHVPTEAEFNSLIAYLGSMSVAGGKLKEAGITHWESPNIGATNETGFTALPCGERTTVYDYWESSQIGIRGNWWSSTENTDEFAGDEVAGILILENVQNEAYIQYKVEQCGLAVRCIKDN